MNISDYPPQEPLTEIGELYHTEVMKRAGNKLGVSIQHGDDPYQSLAVFEADQPNGDVVCVMHGGGWTSGYKEWMAFMAPALTSRGVTFISLGYRLAPGHVFPAGFEDCCDGLSWVYHNIAKHGGDPDRIFVGGHSSGAHYASLMALRHDWQGIRKLPDNVVKGALPISGTYEFGPDSGLSMRPRFLGPQNAGNDKIASPINYISKNACGFFVSYGSDDFPHLVSQSQKFCERLKQHGILVETLELAGCNHLGASYTAGDPEGAWLIAAERFMKSVQ